MKISVSPRVLGAVLAWLLRLWGGTLRFERVNAATFFDPAVQARRPIIILWHDEIFPLIPSHADVGLACVISQSQDGELLSEVVARFGFATVRGSSSRGGLRALIAAKRFMEEAGKGVIFTVDGPRGPRHQVKPGAIFLAEHAGSPIIPVRVAMEKSMIFDKSWDKFQLPWIFSRCVITYGDPIELPPTGGDQDALNQQCRFLEARLHELGQR